MLDLSFRRIAKYTDERKEIEAFIRKHEHLGSIPAIPKRYFEAREGNKIVSAIITAEPNGIHRGILGADKQEIECLIARGATIAGYKNAPSWIISRVIKWHLRNTNQRVFIGYADTKKFGEMGIVYQACGFRYLGNNWGSGNQRSLAKKKYALIKGRTKKEAKALNTLFEQVNPSLIDLPYPID